MGAPILKFIQHLVQGDPGAHIEGLGKPFLQQVAEGDFIPGVEHDHILHQQELVDVINIAIVNRYPAVALCKYLGHGLIVHPRVHVEHEDLIDGGHDLLNRSLPQLQNTLKNCDLIVDEIPVVFSGVHLEQLHHLLSVIHIADLFFEHVIQDPRDRGRDQVQGNHKENDNIPCVVSNGEPVPRTYGLRDDFPKNNNPEGDCSCTNYAAGQISH
mmetsp:Transcript_14858/g.24191  ORF Transcript_14858/g.24191 Transcript_14858/m.24191 type:complete len:213 (-) Transcript_14858:505-1143(-)